MVDQVAPQVRGEWEEQGREARERRLKKTRLYAEGHGDTEGAEKSKNRANLKVRRYNGRRIQGREAVGAPGARSTMDVKLDAETEKLVQKEIETGRFPDAAALVGTALQHYLMARELGEEYTREEIDGKIARGLAQLDAGQGVDGEEFFEQLRKRSEDLQAHRK